VSEVDPDTRAAIESLTADQLLEGMPYACGSAAKVLWLARRHEVFANKAHNDHNTHMAAILWNPDDNRHSIEPNRRTPPPLPPRLIVTQSHAPQGTMTCQQRTHNSQD